MDEPPVQGLDPDRWRACDGCGWRGLEAQMTGSGPTGDGQGLECPRCGDPAGPETPSVEAILGARRTPPDGGR
jgi:hypothetical protein